MSEDTCPVITGTGIHPNVNINGNIVLLLNLTPHRELYFKILLRITWAD
jgi:hypothetical protein